MKMTKIILAQGKRKIRGVFRAWKLYTGRIKITGGGGEEALQRMPSPLLTSIKLDAFSRVEIAGFIS